MDMTEEEEEGTAVKATTLDQGIKVHSASLGRGAEEPADGAADDKGLAAAARPRWETP